MVRNESEFGKLRKRQFAEELTLQARQVVTRRETAKKEGLMASTLEELDKNLTWEEESSGRGYKIAYGYTPEQKEDPAKVAYFCKYCESWIQGIPSGKRYDNIGPLSGSKGVKYNCQICDITIGEFIEEIS